MLPHRIISAHWHTDAIGPGILAQCESGAELHLYVGDHVDQSQPALHYLLGQLSLELTLVDKRLAELRDNIDHAEKAIEARPSNFRNMERTMWPFLDSWRAEHASKTSRRDWPVSILKSNSAF